MADESEDAVKGGETGDASGDASGQADTSAAFEVEREAALVIARIELIAKLDGRHYRPLVDWALRPIALLGPRGFQHEPYPSWLKSLLLVPLVLVLAYAIGRLGSAGPEVFGELFGLCFSGALAAACIGVATDLLTRLLQISLAEAVVPNMRSLADLRVIEGRLDKIFDPRRQLAFTVVAGGLIFAALWWVMRSYPAHQTLALSTVTFALALSGASALYFSAPMMSFLPRLGRLDLELYQANPRDSLVIVSLVATSNQVLYIFTAMCTLISLIAEGHGLFDDAWLEVGLLSALWIPVTVSFIGANMTFRSMIVRSKWGYLSRLQAKIEALQDNPSFPDDGLLDKTKALMAHHDEVRATPNSTIDLQAWLAYFNSLLLPFIAGVLANIQPILIWLGVAEGG